MATVNVSIKNLNKLISVYKRSPEIVGKGLQEVIKETAFFLLRQTKKNITSGTGMWKAPVDKGIMRQGIGVEFEKMRAVIQPSFETPYALYVHEGTKFMRKRPFFEITADVEKEGIEKVLQKGVDKILKSYEIR